MLGLDTPPDPVAAEALFVRGCDLGSAKSCAALFKELRKGGRLRTNRPYAASVAEKACRRGDEEGCGYAGMDAWFGVLDAPDHRLAVEILSSSCERGGGWSCMNLAALAELGALGDAAAPEARALYARACRLDVADACALVK